MLKKKQNDLAETVQNLEHKLKVYNLVEQNLKPLKEDTLLFLYEENYKRFKLAFDVKFVGGKYGISYNDIETDKANTIANINSAGKKLLQTIDKLNYQRKNNYALKDVSYLLIISGYASKSSGGMIDNYELSYKRAFNLWKYWRDMGIDFEKEEYEGLIDLQIAGNGLGGVGRIPFTSVYYEEKNQRFIIQIIPKIGNTID